MIAPWKNDKFRKVYDKPVIKASIEIILSVFTVVFLLFFAVRSTLATVATLQKKIEDQTVVDRKLTTKIAQLSKAQADLATYANQLSDFSTAVPDGADQGGLTKRIELVTKENNFTVNHLTLEAVPIVGLLIDLSNKEKGAVRPTQVGSGKVVSFNVDLDVSGNQDRIVNFISGLENMDRLMMFTDVDIKKEEQKLTGSVETKKGVRVIGTATAYYEVSANP